jgi:hypothetical protein
VAFVVLFLWDHPTPSVIFWTAIVALAALALIEFFGREPLPAGAMADRTAAAIVPSPS